MWTLAQGLAVVRMIEPRIRQLDHHTILGGSVLHKGLSAKDLDIFISPLEGYRSRGDEVYNYLTSFFGPLRSIRDAPDYGPEQGPHWWAGAWTVKYGEEEKRIDLFLLRP